VFDQEAPPASDNDKPGRRLRSARQDQGLTLDRVAADLHLAPAIIEAVERGDYDALPGPVFVAGYIRNYARLLGLDPDPLLASYRAARPQHEPLRSSAGPILVPRPPTGGGKLALGLAGLGALLLAVGLAFLGWQGRLPAGAWFRSEPSAVEPEATEPDLAEPDVTDSMNTEPGGTRSIPASGSEDDSKARSGIAPPAPDPSEGPPPAEPAADAPPRRPSSGGTEATARIAAARTEAAPGAGSGRLPGSATPGAEMGPLPGASPAAGAVPTATDQDPAAAAGETGAAAARGRSEIALSFDGLCWVDVRDSARTFKLFGEMKKGDRRVLAGEPPYKITLGNAAVTRITIDGKEFDLNAVSRGGVARFTLDPDTWDEKPSN